MPYFMLTESQKRIVEPELEKALAQDDMVLAQIHLLDDGQVACRFGHIPRSMARKMLWLFHPRNEEA